MPSENNNSNLPNLHYPINSSRTILVDEDALQQGVSESGKMSAVRRFFCLFVTFDLFFMLMLWIICTVATGLTLNQAFSDDVVHYNIHTSMFDVFLISAIRFTCLLLAYSLFRLNHWWVVALTTAGSCAFLISKVFLFNFSSEWTRSYTFNLLLIIASFIISWTEAWFYDCRVLPAEKKAIEILHGIEDPTEQSSLLYRYLRSTQNYTAPSETCGTFYSPIGSPAGSEYDFQHYDDADRSSQQLTPAELEYKKIGKETLEAVCKLIVTDGWKLERKSAAGDTVHSKPCKNVGKMFMLTADLDINPEVLLEELFYKIENSPKWNPTLLFCKVLQRIDSHTDISYNVAAEGAGGLVSTRDFVSLRHWEIRNDHIVSAAISVVHSDMPPQKKYTRGENGPSAWVIKINPADPQKCQFQWLLNTNLKGWIPQYLVDQALSGVLLDYIGYLRKHAVNLMEEEQP